MIDFLAQLKRRSILRAGALCAAAVCLGAQAQTATAPIPNFAPDDHTSWIPDRVDGGDNFLPPESGPGPIMEEKVVPYQSPLYRLGDLSNPILQPWVREQMRRDYDAVRAGKTVSFVARERCLPGGVPEFNIYRRPFAPMVFFIQTPKEVLYIWRADSQVRHIYMNVPHSAQPKPSWYGESVGHYEGDTLVVDTIGLNTKTFVDNRRTPHTDRLHVVERFHMIEGGKKMEVNIHVEDPGAFTMPWNAVQRFVLSHPTPLPASADTQANGTLYESACAEGIANDHFNYGDTLIGNVVPVPVAEKPDF